MLTNWTFKYKKKKSRHRLYKLHTQNKSKWITNLNVQQTIKLLQDNIVENLNDLGYRDDFQHTTLKALKEITGKLNFIKIQNFCSVKDNAKRMRRQAWKKILAKDIYLGLTPFRMAKICNTYNNKC